MTAATSAAVTSGYAERAIWGAPSSAERSPRPGTRETFAVTEPATGRQLARVVSGGAGLVHRAVARRGAPTRGGVTRRPVNAEGCCGWWPRRSAPTPRN